MALPASDRSSVAVSRLFARDLHPGDVVTEIQGAAPNGVLAPALHIHDGKLVFHYSVVDSVRQDFEDQLEGDARQFPLCVVTVSGYENGTKLDQGASEFRVRPFATVEVIEGRISDYWSGA